MKKIIAVSIVLAGILFADGISTDKHIDGVNNTACSLNQLDAKTAILTCKDNKSYLVEYSSYPKMVDNISLILPDGKTVKIK